MLNNQFDIHAKKQRPVFGFKKAVTTAEVKKAVNAVIENNPLDEIKGGKVKKTLEKDTLEIKKATPEKEQSSEIKAGSGPHCDQNFWNSGCTPNGKFTCHNSDQPVQKFMTGIKETIKNIKAATTNI